MDRRLTRDGGFSLIEVLIAMGILATALMALAGVFTLGMANMATSSANLIAREKAREAIESVHSARDTRTITWAQINNVSSGGVFLDGEQPIRNTGTDGLVDTADDTGTEAIVAPGPDGLLGTADDISTPLTNFTRQLVISQLLDDNGNVNANLRKITVTINYTVGPIRRTYSITTYISSIS